MSKFLETLNNSANFQLRESNGKINQRDRNALRAMLMEVLAEDLQGVITNDGVILEMTHDYWGSVFMEVNLKIKGDYDLLSAEAQYKETLEKRQSRAEAQKAKVEKAKKSE